MTGFTFKVHRGRKPYIFLISAKSVYNTGFYPKFFEFWYNQLRLKSVFQSLIVSCACWVGTIKTQKNIKKLCLLRIIIFFSTVISEKILFFMSKSYCSPLQMLHNIKAVHPKQSLFSFSIGFIYLILRNKQHLTQLYMY